MAEKCSGNTIILYSRSARGYSLRHKHDKKEDGHTTLNPQISAIFTPLPVIKHTIHGDANITDDVKSIKNLANMNYDIKR